MSGPALDHAGRPVRVGMVLTSTEKNNSNQVNEILQMPPAGNILPFSARQDINESWVHEQSNYMSEGSPNKGNGGSPAQDATLEDLSHVATR